MVTRSRTALLILVLIAMLALQACVAPPPAPAGAPAAAAPTAAPAVPEAAEATEPPAEPAAAAPEGEAELTTVRIATLPYLDYTGLIASHALGLDREQGLEFEFVPFALEPPAVQALLRGDIDVAQGAIGSFVPILPQAPELRIFLNNDQFKGFVYIGREGEIQTFDELLAENNNDFAAAQQATLEQFRGKTILLVKSSFEGMLQAALQQAGLTLDDVTVLDFQNDAQAAAAFLRGEGDLYTGSLPQEMRLLKEPGYVAVAGNEVLGPAGLWFSNSATTEQYLNENRETILKLVAVYYRTMRYLDEKSDQALTTMIEYLNEQAATNLTLEDAQDQTENYVDFSTVEASQEGVYNPDSPVYWRTAAEYFVEQNESLDKIPAGSVDIDTVIVQEELFNELLANQELMDWINSPIE